MMLDRLPKIYHPIKEFVELMNAEQQAFDKVEATFNKVLDNQYVATSDVSSVKRLEAILNIQADPTKESLSFRRKRILNRYLIKPPFTVRYLQQRLDFLVGQGRTFVEVDSPFIIRVKTNVEDAILFKELERTVRTTIPANLVYQQQTTVHDKIELKERIVRKEVTWNYKLDGTWKLGEKPFASYGQGVNVK
jgi:Uncharacterised protein conserved in bacteria (DUF2313)